MPPFQIPPELSYDGDKDAEADGEIYARGIPQDTGWIINASLNLKARPPLSPGRSGTLYVTRA